MSDTPVLTDAEFDAIKAQLRARWPNAVGGDLPDVLSFSQIATHTETANIVFQEVDFAEPPEWAPFLPKAGIYNHPIAGELDFSPATYERIIGNFKSGLYQDRLPVNAEHAPKASGAIGWITDLRLNDDTSVDAKVEWNERGKALIEGDRFRYVSAEVLLEWTDPVDQTAYRDVATGLAICTNPYFKESVLRPLAASDAVWTLGPATGQEGSRMSDPTKTASGEQPAAVQLTEAEVLEFRELKQKADAQAVELAEAKKIADAQALELTEIRTANRVKKFTDEVRGKSDANNRPWFGDAKGHVDHLVKLSESFGEDSPEVSHYVATNRASAEAIGKSALFTQFGNGGPAEPNGSAFDQLMSKAVELSEKESITKEQAFVKVKETHRDLARQMIAERG